MMSGWWLPHGFVLLCSLQCALGADDDAVPPAPHLPDPCANINCEHNSRCVVAPNGTWTCQCHDACIAIYDPVCANNGVTYSSRCDYEMVTCREKLNDVHIIHAGACGVGDPCATTNMCRNYGICTVTANGSHSCHCSTEMCPLTFRYDPVCGSDGRTYPGDCELKKVSCEQQTAITVAHRGECGVGDACVINLCDHYGICMRAANNSHTCHCPTEMCPLTFRYDPVCGSDGRTYPGECELKKESCQRQVRITVAHPGECGGAIPCGNTTCRHYGQCLQRPDGRRRCGCMDACTEEYSPICGSDRKTYSNLCNLQAASCNTQTAITVDHDGECVQITPCAAIRCGYYAVCRKTSDDTYGCACHSTCPPEDNPLCGSNNVNFSNRCNMETYACQMKQMITVKHYGVCNANDTITPCATMLCPYGKTCVTTIEGKGECVCQHVCTRDYRPVCGSDGITYPNECEIRCKLSGGVTVLHTGPCEVQQPNVFGSVHLPDFHSPHFLDNSCLRVLIFDDMLADAPSVMIAESIYRISPRHKPGDVLRYTVPLDSGNSGRHVAASAVINVNWCSHGDTDWVRPGDYLTTEAYHVFLEDNEPEQLNLRLEYYGASSVCSNSVPCSHGTHCIEIDGGKMACMTCNLACTKEYDPVCGSDGRTYSNACMATALNSCTQRKVQVEHSGNCNDEDAKKVVWIAIIVMASICILITGIVAFVHFSKKGRAYAPEISEKKMPPAV